MKLLLPILACASLLPSCHKNNGSAILTGTWKLTETYQGPQIGWQRVNQSGEITLTFKNDSTYSLIPPPISSMSGCNGTYRIPSANIIVMTNCPPNPFPEDEFTYSLTNVTLILEHKPTGSKGKYVRQ